MMECKEGFSEEVMCELRTEVISGAKWRENIPDRGNSKQKRKHEKDWGGRGRQ